MPLEVNFNSSTGGPTDTFNYFTSLDYRLLYFELCKSRFERKT